MRFIAPPSWPAPPLGWLPPAGWAPEPGWGPAPQGWSFFAGDDGTHARVLRTDVPAWDPRSVGVGEPADAPHLATVGASYAGGFPPVAPPAFGGPASGVPALGSPAAAFPGYTPAFPPSLSLGADPAAQARDERRKALRTFGGGAALFLLGAGSTVVAERSAGGGFIWTGGMIFGAVLMGRSFVAYRASRTPALPVRTTSVVAVLVALLLCAGSAAFALVSAVENGAMPEDTGSCWTAQDDENLAQVPCSRDHEYRVVATVADQDLCPAESSYLVELSETSLGCLVDD